MTKEWYCLLEMRWKACESQQESSWYRTSFSHLLKASVTTKTVVVEARAEFLACDWLRYEWSARSWDSLLANQSIKDNLVHGFETIWRAITQPVAKLHWHPSHEIWTMRRSVSLRSKRLFVIASWTVCMSGFWFSEEKAQAWESVKIDLTDWQKQLRIRDVLRIWTQCLHALALPVRRGTCIKQSFAPRGSTLPTSNFALLMGLSLTTDSITRNLLSTIGFNTIFTW